MIAWPPPVTRRAQPQLTKLPDVIVAPTGYLLPAGTVYGRMLTDTAFGFASDVRIGLGDVAEFGIGTMDRVRARKTADDELARLRASPVATFRMGVAENRLFTHQPALSLGFSKSFARSRNGYKDQFAVLSLAATKALGGVQFTLGLDAWDASITSTTDESAPPRALHDLGVAKQLRPFAGIVAKATTSADVMIDAAWTPDYCYACTNPVQLHPVLSWGVRYNATPWLRVESGVRVSDIAEANLLNSEIFGQVTIINQTLRRSVLRR